MLALAGLIAIACWACGAGAVRPRFEPFPEAIVDTVTGQPDALAERISELLMEEGIELRWVREREGYVETKWFNPVTGETGGGRSLNTYEIVRMRFWTDLAMEHQSVVVGEAVHRRVVDPSLPERQREVHIPRNHPGHEILGRVFELLVSAEHQH